MNTKVFLIIPSLHKGGAERVISILANSLEKRGYDVCLTLLNESAHAYQINSNIRVQYLNKENRGTSILSRIGGAINTFTKLAGLVRQERPDVIISFITSANIWAGIMGNLFGIPYFVSERNSPKRNINRLNKVHQRLVKFFYSRAKVIIVPSKGMIAGFGQNPLFRNVQNYAVIPNPVTTFGVSMPEQVHPRPFILAVGRLNRVKGFDLLIEAYQSIQTDTDLIILGEGAERADLEKRIAKAGLTDRVFLIGTKSNVQDYYKQCALYVLSSRTEGYPNVLIEALSLGCPAVAFDCDFGPAEIIRTGENGLLVQKENVRELANAIQLVLNDEALRQKLAANALATGALNATDSIVDTWEELISQAVPTAVVALKEVSNI